MTEEWFESEETAGKEFTLPPPSYTPNDIMTHVSKLSRLIEAEHSIRDRLRSTSGYNFIRVYR